MNTKFDCIVVGAGHAGCEAAIAAARLGLKVLLCTLNIDNIALMPCNPAIGGPAKSTLVREIDALGGVMGLAADATYIQMKMLNSSKGPAVRALRAQSDKREYMDYMRNLIEGEQNIYLRQAAINELIVEKGAVTGVVDEFGIDFSAPAVVLTTGTSLGGRLFVGLQSYSGGRLGEAAATGLTQSLNKNGIKTGKLKTGTPPRVDGRTIDYSKMIVQPGDEQLHFYSFRPGRPVRPQVPCYLTRTGEKTHEIIRANLDKSPMFQGLIEGTGPRYCPSIEDKIVRFAANPSHHIFIEPEGLNTYEVYIQGFSSSLPAVVQAAMLQSMPGLESAHIIKPAYAVEYDYVPAVQTRHSLMSKTVNGLFFAGQINGTSGYEEAAAQGLIAGINAANHVRGADMLELDRSSSYIGTLIDDLVTKDINEPYRMLTSRSEYRLLLRQDNADARLTPIGYKAGLVDDAQFAVFEAKQAAIEQTLRQLSAQQKQLLKRPEVNYNTLENAPQVADDVAEQVEIILKYDGYIKRQQAQVEQSDKLEKFRIPDDIDWSQVKHISGETRDKLSKIRPKTLAQASRIGGVKPADISVLMVLLNSSNS